MPQKTLRKKSGKPALEQVEDLSWSPATVLLYVRTWLVRQIAIAIYLDTDSYLAPTVWQ